MTSNRDGINAILDSAVFELETEALGRVRCNAVLTALMPSNGREEIKTEELDGPTFVHKLLVRGAQRIEERHENNDKTEMGTPLSESDIRQLTDAEIESFAREISTRNTWLFESYEAAERPRQTNEKGEQVVSVEQGKVKFPRNEGQRDSDYLVRAARRYMTEHRRGEKLVKSLGIRPSLPRLLEGSAKSLGIRPSLPRLLEGSAKSLVTNPLSGLSGRITKNLAEAIKVPNQDSWNRINRITASYRIATDLQNQAAQFRTLERLPLESITKRLAISERLFAGVNFASIRLSATIPELTTLQLQASIEDMTTTYGELAKSLRTDSAAAARLSGFVLPSAAREVLATSYTANVLGVFGEADVERGLSEIQSAAEAEIEEGNSNCVVLLEAVDPNLVRLYEGAYDALQGVSPDRERHFLSSLRELYDHLMRGIAPNQEILEWIESDNKDDKTLLHKGRPTRTARIRYVLRNLNDGPLTNFTATDTRAFVDFLDVFQRVHKLRPTFSELELRALWLRANSWLTYILQLIRSG